jgi:alpha/beta superfamily hydrolase
MGRVAVAVADGRATGAGPWSGPVGEWFTAEHAMTRMQATAANPIARFIAFSFGARKTAENATSMTARGHAAARDAEPASAEISRSVSPSQAR